MLQHNDIREPTKDMDRIIVRGGKGLTIWAWGLTGDEKVYIQLPKTKNFHMYEDSHWTDNFLELKEGDWVKTIYGPFIARITKEATTNDAGFGYVYG